ncbi:glycosyltransferase family 4 protein [Clostridium manihotivorum]|uniref:Glycosyltransferase family 1 protein n=1 Tax=Clostridium manihotivorum TaxID=2320868 RepID=A0A410DQJ5_9CLOT|nr:glycosyltransferase family 1 protein [Clostridium manihotivorum]QAA31301.1 glycosyltransferase family 1 protein [Clostridium manihotivorum]
MRIAVDARGINWYKGTGIGTYTYNVLKNLLSIDLENDYSIFWSGPISKEFTNDKTEVIMASRRHQRFFENIYFPNYLYDKKVDLYHIPQNGIGLNDQINCKKIVTIHDLIPYIMPETVGKGYLKKFLSDMPKIMESCDGILTVSEYSKKDILKFFPSVDESKIFVTPLAADTSFMPLDKAQCRKITNDRFNFNTEFLLYIGGFSTRKNALGIIQAFNKLRKDTDLSLVIVGSLRDEGMKLVDICKELNLEDRVIFTGFVEDSFLPILYNGCQVFIYPSLYEGFGLPPLEAMSCKTPVITSSVTSIPEVVLDTALLINPLSSQELYEAMGKLISSKEARESLALKGYERSKLFNWQKTSEATLKAYNAVLSQV